MINVCFQGLVCLLKVKLATRRSLLGSISLQYTHNSFKSLEERCSVPLLVARRPFPPLVNVSLALQCAINIEFSTIFARWRGGQVVRRWSRSLCANQRSRVRTPSVPFTFFSFLFNRISGTITIHATRKQQLKTNNSWLSCGVTSPEHQIHQQLGHVYLVKLPIFGFLVIILAK